VRFIKNLSRKEQRGGRLPVFVYNSKDEPTKPQALAFTRRARNQAPAVLSTVYKLLLREAETHDIPANRFPLREWNYTDPCVATKQRLPDNSQKSPRSQLWGNCSTALSCTPCTTLRLPRTRTSPSKSSCKSVSAAKSDAYYLGKEVFKNDFAHCHEVWRDFFSTVESFNAGRRIIHRSRPSTGSRRNQRSKTNADGITSSVQIILRAFVACKRNRDSARYSHPYCVGNAPPVEGQHRSGCADDFECTPGFETRALIVCSPRFSIPGRRRPGVMSLGRFRCADSSCRSQSRFIDGQHRGWPKSGREFFLMTAFRKSHAPTKYKFKSR